MSNDSKPRFSTTHGGKFYILRILMKNETFLRPLIIFIVFYSFILLQNWSDITFLLVPISTFVLYAFFKIIDVSKEHTLVLGSDIAFNPIGNESRISNRLFFCSLLELIIVFVMGAESYRNPHLIDIYFIYYVVPLILIYNFSLYYALYDVGFSSKIEIMIRRKAKFEQDGEINTDKPKGEPLENQLISFMRLSDFKIIYRLITIIFILLSSIWLILTFLGYVGLIPNLSLNLPGSKLYEGVPLEVSFFIYVCIIGIPLSIISITVWVYKIITQIDKPKLNSIIAELPAIRRKKIIKTLEFYTDKTPKRKNLEQDI